jgi:hypothetical protein
LKKGTKKGVEQMTSPYVKKIKRKQKIDNFIISILPIVFSIIGSFGIMNLILFLIYN